MKKAKLITSSAVVMTMVMSSIVPAFAYSKEETVYSKLKTNGSEKTTVVSEHLINDQNETSLDDQSSLKNIKNVNGKETFIQDGSSLVWQTTDGQDIYYQGKTTNSLPVSMKVTYKLDGKKTKLKDMLGKKGKVEIQIDYTNNEKQTVDGKELYVPFVVTTGTMLPTKTDSNIEVTNGKRTHFELIIDESQIDLVNIIFSKYKQLGSINGVETYLFVNGYKTQKNNYLHDENKHWLEYLL